MGSMISTQLTTRDKRPKTLHHVPEEIIEEILCNLPVKNLLRFKCVSKQWRSSISGKQFINRHLAKISSSTDHHNDITSSSYTLVSTTAVSGRVLSDPYIRTRTSQVSIITTQTMSSPRSGPLPTTRTTIYFVDITLATLIIR